jgi:hypothetical protein
VTIYGIGNGDIIPMAKAILDRGMEKLISRKLLVWVTATALAFSGFLTSADWILISVVYVASQGAVDIVARLKGT